MGTLGLARLAAMLGALAAVVSAQAGDVAKGGQIYSAQCLGCHGRTGISVMPRAPNFARSEGLMQPDVTLLASIKAGKNAMPAYVGILSDRDILDVIAYIRTLRR